MRLCIPTVSEAGLSARLSPHFGSAPWFTVVDSETGATSAIENEHARHEHGQCAPTRSLEGKGIGVVVCRGLGRRALMNLEGQGMQVLVTEEWTVAGALEAYRAGSLPRLDPASACAGHEHAHGGGHRLA